MGAPPAGEVTGVQLSCTAVILFFFSLCFVALCWLPYLDGVGGTGALFRGCWRRLRDGSDHLCSGDGLHWLFGGFQHPLRRAEGQTHRLPAGGSKRSNSRRTRASHPDLLCWSCSSRPFVYTRFIPNSVTCWTTVNVQLHSNDLKKKKFLSTEIPLLKLNLKQLLKEVHFL